MSWAAALQLATTAAGIAKPAAPAVSGNTDPMFGPLLTNFDTSNWAVNFGDAGTASVTAGPKTGPTLTSEPTQANSQYAIPQNVGGIGAPPQAQYKATTTGAAAIPWNLVLMFGGAAALILLWKR